MDGGLEHFLEDLALVSGHALLQLAKVGEVHTKGSEEARIKAIHEGLINTDGKQLLVDEWTRGSKDMCIIVKNQGEDCVAIGVLICLLDVVESSMRLLGVSRVELVEKMI